jgi:hypothetical protein
MSLFRTGSSLPPGASQNGHGIMVIHRLDGDPPAERWHERDEFEPSIAHRKRCLRVRHSWSRSGDGDDSDAAGSSSLTRARGQGAKL